MKYLKFRQTIALSILMLFLALAVVNATAIPQQLEELKMEYEKKYKEYTQAVKDAKSSVIAELSRELQVAKDKYDKAVQAITPSDQTKEKINNTTKKIAEGIKDIFDIKTADSPTAPTNDNHLNGYAQQSININGKNYCGQFAMTSVLNGLGISADAQKMYKDTNPAGIFTAPTTITEYLNLNGVDAVKRNNATITDIARKIDQGLPVMVLVATDDGTPHWVNVYGYNTNAQGRITSVTMRDSYWGTNAPYTMDVTTFLDRWQKPLGNGFAGNFVSYSNLMIDIKGTKTPDKAPKLANFNFSTATEDNIANGINDVVTGFKNIDPIRLVSGTAKCILGVPGAAIGIASVGVSNLADKFNDWRKLNLKKPGVVNTVLNATAATAVFGVKAVTAVGKVAGNALSSVASMAGNFINKLGYVFR